MRDIIVSPGSAFGLHKGSQLPSVGSLSLSVPFPLTSDASSRSRDDTPSRGSLELGVFE